MAWAQIKWAPGEEEIYQKAQQHMAAGRAADAVPLGEQRLALAQKKFGKTSSQSANALAALASYCAEAGERGRARDLYKEAIATAQKVHGKEDGWIIASLRGLGRLEAEDGHFDEALPLLKRAVAAAEKLLGKKEPMTVLMVEDLAQALARKRDYLQALPLFERVLQARESALGKENPGVANALVNLAFVQKGLGRWDEAEASLSRSLAMHEKTSGPEHPHTAVALEHLGQFYRDLGHYDRAFPLLERSLVIKEKLLGPEHPGTIISIHGLAVIRKSQLQYAEAEVLFRRAYETGERALGRDHQTVVKAGGDLGSLLCSKGNLAEGLPLLRTYLLHTENALGPDSALLVEPLNNLGMTLSASGEFAQAEPILRRALELAEKRFGPDGQTPDAARSNLVWCLHGLGKDDEARSLARVAVEHSCKWWEELLSFGSEAQLEQAYRRVSQNGVGESLGDAELAALISLRFKDSLTGAMLENQRRARAASKGSATQKLASASESARARLRDLVQQQAEPDTLAKAQAEAEAAEKALTRKLTRLDQTRTALQVTPQQVAEVLPPGAVLIEFTHHTVHGKPRAGVQEEVSSLYSAILISSGQEPRLVPLGDAKGLESQIDAFLKLMQEPPEALSQTDLDAATEKAVKSLHAAVIAPLLGQLPPGTNTLVLSPDSLLHFVPFAALMDESGRFLTETYTLRHVTSGRDLLQSPRPLGTAKKVVLLGDPDYKKSLKDTKPMDNPRLKEMGGQLGFDPLPGTAAEIKDLAAQFQAQKWEITVLSGSAATEASITGQTSPTVLHLATHGFFLDPRHSQTTLPGAGDSLFAGSMASSGLVFAAADTTMKSWAQGRAPAASEDGMLSAAEAAHLNLEKTELVTLSACETGLGVAMSGNGVAGLKRALTQAGARHLLTTLWKVNDEETALFMQSFYTRFLGGEDAATALSQTLSSRITQLRSQQGTWYAINGAAPFVLTATSRWTP